MLTQQILNYERDANTKGDQVQKIKEMEAQIGQLLSAAQESKLQMSDKEKEIEEYLDKLDILEN